MSQMRHGTSSEVAPVVSAVRAALVALVALVAGGVQSAAAQALEPIAYVIRIPEPSTHEIVVQATVPATASSSVSSSGSSSLDLMMPTWSPGYYRVEDYAANVREIRAQTIEGEPLVIEKTNGNHWRVDARGQRVVRLSYRVFDDGPGGKANEFRATDYEMLVDSPIVAGKLGIRTFEVLDGVPARSTSWSAPVTPAGGMAIGRRAI